MEPCNVRGVTLNMELKCRCVNKIKYCLGIILVYSCIKLTKNNYELIINFQKVNYPVLKFF